MEQYYTVQEYASLTGKDTGNLRRMLAQGRLLGEKIGNQWVIPKDVPLPPDLRVRCGAYHNSRKRAVFLQKHRDLYESVNRMCKSLADLCGGQMQEALLYGSYARGDEEYDSDIDIALLCEQPISQELQERIAGIVVDYELELGVTLSVIDIEMPRYAQWKNVLPFYRNIAKEGITLWKRK